MYLMSKVLQHLYRHDNLVRLCLTSARVEGCTYTEALERTVATFADRKQKEDARMIEACRVRGVSLTSDECALLLRKLDADPSLRSPAGFNDVRRKLEGCIRG